MSLFLAAMRREAVRIFTDPGALILLVIAAIAYGVIYPVPYERQVLRDVPVAVVDQRPSALSRQLTRMLDTHPLARVALVTSNLPSAERALERGEVSGIVIVPRDLGETIARREPAQVLVLADATYFLIYKNVLTAALESAGTLSAGLQIRTLAARGVPFDVAAVARAPIVMDMRPLFNPIESYAAYVVPAVMIVILHQLLLIGIGMLQGTDREATPGGAPAARLTPVQALVVLAGRTMPLLALFFLHAAFYFGTLLPWLGLPVRASAGALAAFLLPFLLATMWLGMAAGALFRTRESALAILFCTSMPIVFGSGFAWPREAMAGWVVEAMQFVPAGPAINGALRLTQMAAPLADVAPEWHQLWRLAALFFLLAWIAEWRRPQPAAGLTA